MKNTLLFLLISFLTSSTMFSQESSDSATTQPGNEVKINMTNLIVFKWLDVGYEYILNEESSIGIGTLISFNSDKDNNDDLDEYRTFSLTPYYRHFFSKKYAQGFFVEGFAMLHSGKDDYYDYNTSTYYDEKYTDLAIGISAGAKFVTARGFIAEIYLGLGRDMLEQSDIEIAGRGGIALGFRF
ncbi:DUF3575 domain-containing protein [Mariniflexile sp. AS56]|uniref:DUF3575 domain-containing protein n=1 Tax=Mariniflexile sp. AS56 TaxID=3063957 RepID=UPI0026F00A25|nr:DUF3575 domain-containing protein [Mariniflexile sp. AS56]MDO7170939.1 DUF3575 domain-containing protein [Mariniflexile sp. AS56]